LLTFLVGSYLSKRTSFGMDVILGSFVVAMTVIAILSNLECRKILRKRS